MYVCPGEALAAARVAAVQEKRNSLRPGGLATEF
jgi:hypothetical protein